jgi:hypothetical protein
MTGTIADYPRFTLAIIWHQNYLVSVVFRFLLKLYNGSWQASHQVGGVKKKEKELRDRSEKPARRDKGWCFGPKRFFKSGGIVFVNSVTGPE